MVSGVLFWLLWLLLFLSCALLCRTGGPFPRFCTRLPLPVEVGRRPRGGGGVQVGQFGVVGGGGGWHKVGLNIIHQISFMAAFATSLLSILDPNTHSNPSLG